MKTLKFMGVKIFSLASICIVSATLHSCHDNKMLSENYQSLKPSNLSNSKNTQNPQKISSAQNSINSSCIATTTLEYNDTSCALTGGCTLTFTCTLMSDKDLLPINKLANSIQPLAKIPTPVPMTIATLTINSPNLLQSSAGTAQADWYNTPVDCTQDGTAVTCVNFLPIANDFTINGTLGDQDLTLNVFVENQITPALTPTQCGQEGTTVQRMFDCSQRVQNYAGYAETTTGTLHIFAPGDNPDPSWFLVSCPNTTISERCFWPSPVMVSSNQSVQSGLGAQRYDSLGNETSNYVNGRLLWSGISTSSYAYLTANGSNPFDAYNNTLSMQGVIQNPPGVMRTNTKCQGVSTDPVRLNGSAYSWQMPSYPIMMTLTLNNGTCTPGSCNPLGFRANGTLPGFTTPFWTSSQKSGFTNTPYFAFSAGKVIPTRANIIGIYARCVSATW